MEAHLIKNNAMTEKQFMIGSQIDNVKIEYYLSALFVHWKHTTRKPTTSAKYDAVCKQLIVFIHTAYLGILPNNNVDECPRIYKVEPIPFVFCLGRY